MFQVGADSDPGRSRSSVAPGNILVSIRPACDRAAVRLPARVRSQPRGDPISDRRPNQVGPVGGVCHSAANCVKTLSRMTTHDEREYVLGTNDEELTRLGFQHRVWGEHAFALWNRAGFAPGQTILDAGCGPGFATLDLARLVGPRGRIIAVDHSARFLDHLNCSRPRTRRNFTRRGRIVPPTQPRFSVRPPSST